MTEGSSIPTSDEMEKEIIGQVMGMHWSCARFVTLVVRDEGNGMFDIIYVFYTESGLVEKRFTISRELELESISDLWAGAEMMEREAVDLFGLKIKGVEGGILLVPGKSPTTPLRKNIERKEGEVG